MPSRDADWDPTERAKRDPPQRGKIPEPTIRRLSLYLRELREREETGQTTMSSKQLGEALGLTDAQVRKDLAVFGQFGHPGVGYRTGELIERIRKILGKDHQWNACIVGAGNIGRALLPYGRFRRDGFDLVAIFDRDPTVVGTSIGDHRVRPLEDLPSLVKSREIKIGIIAVPAEAAQETANRLIEAGVIGLLNFAPRRLDVGQRASVVNVDFSVALEQLAFQISLGHRGSTNATKS
ncbi:MAG: redox-sensing transcriptional repressor Rex [Phycisphaerae bacterium]|jgi:redox-sensing transcriptional repressor|nr:redox-sensing transcriptional repressor Rex [Phycisphaerae bacterium]